MPASKLRKISKDRYEAKRELKNISLNTETDADVLSILNRHSFVLSRWVKHILRSYTPAELVVLDHDINAIPAVLIEKAIESGMFDLDEYLAAQGKKIVDSSSHPALNDMDLYDIDQSLGQHDQYEFESRVR